MNGVHFLEGLVGLGEVLGVLDDLADDGAVGEGDELGALGIGGGWVRWFIFCTWWWWGEGYGRVIKEYLVEKFLEGE